jgi:hypothetical protein
MTFWTDERQQMLCDLAPHQSASQIAARLGCTRNAVIGRADRSGIHLGKPKSDVSFVIVPAPILKQEPAPIAFNAEILSGKWRASPNRTGYFKARCAKCKELSADLCWGRSGSGYASNVLRQHGWDKTGISSDVLWSCPKCNFTAPKPVGFIPKPVVPLMPVAPYVAGKGKSLFDLGDFDCHWPLGEPADLTYCGQPKANRRYCAHHARISYREPRYRKSGLTKSVTSRNKFIAA